MNYRILQEDGRQYGPISGETLRQWIREGRLHGQTGVQREGASEWLPLNAVPEFQDELGRGHPASGMPATGTPSSAARSSRLAISSLILGILGFLTLGLTALVGMVMGIVALIRIGSSGGALRGRGVAIAGVITSGMALLLVPMIAILAAMLLPALAKAKDKAQSISCMNNCRQMGLAVQIYVTENEGRFPESEWCDLTLGYLGGSNVLVCPSHAEATCSYAYNRNVVGRDQKDLDSETVVLFESDAGWNAVGGPDLLIPQPRHADGVNVGFADGSVRTVPVSQLSNLRWEP